MDPKNPLDSGRERQRERERERERVAEKKREAV